MKKFIDALLTSSEDASKLSARIVGILTTASGYIIFFLGKYGVIISDGQAQLLISQLAIAAGVLYTIFGALRWIVNSAGNKWLWKE